MIRIQTIKAVLATGNLVPIQLHENALDDIVVAMAYEPVVRGVIPLLQWMPIELPPGQRGLTALQALQQAWLTALTVASKHDEAVVGLEIDSFELVPEADVLTITGALPMARI